MSSSLNLTNLINTGDPNRQAVLEQIIKLLSQSTSTKPVELVSVVDSAEADADSKIKSVKNIRQHAIVCFLLPSMTEENLLKLIRENITTSNLPQLWNDVIHKHDDELNELCLDFFFSNMTDEIIGGLSFAIMKFITELDKSPVPEIKMFELVKKWNELMLLSETELKILLANIRFTSIDIKDLVTIVAPSKLLDNATMLQIITDSFDATKRADRYLSPVVIGIGYRDKSYDGFRILEETDFTEKMIEIFNHEMSRHHGFIALEDINLDGLCEYNRQIALKNNHIVCLNKKEYGRLSLTQNKYCKGSVCFVTDDSKIDFKEKITTISTISRNAKSRFAYFVRA